MERSKSRYAEALKLVRKILTQLKQVWQYSDSQPTEITLAGALAVLFPIATYLEIDKKRDGSYMAKKPTKSDQTGNN